MGLFSRYRETSAPPVQTEFEAATPPAIRPADESAEDDRLWQEIGDLLLEVEKDSFADIARRAGLDLAEDFIGGHFPDTDFRGNGRALEGMNLRGALLTNTIWGPTTLMRGILLEGADLSRAKGLTESALARAHTDASTQLPPYLSHARIAEKRAALKLNAPPPVNAEERRMIAFMAKAKP